VKIDKRQTLVVFLTSLTLILHSIVTPGRAYAGDLNVQGFKVSWSDPLYKPNSISRFAFNYSNGTGGRLLNAIIIISDKYGQILARDSVVGVNAGVSGTWNLQISATTFEGKVEPFEIKLSIKDYNENTRELTGRVNFLPIPNSAVSASPAPTASISAQATPVPTVTVTAKPDPGPTVYVTNPADIVLQDLVSSLKSQVSLLEKRLKKICATRPKPRGC